MAIKNWRNSLKELKNHQKYFRSVALDLRTKHYNKHSMTEEKNDLNFAPSPSSEHGRESE